jgi:hypothetical protein
MATSNWSQPAEFGPPGAMPWVEKYRAALLETNPQRRIGRIAEAIQAIQNSTHLAEDSQAMREAKQILRSLREHSASRAAASPWLL